MLNHISIMGRLTRDPELRRTNNGNAVASFTVACERDFAQKGEEKKTDFIDCVAWRQTGEFIAKYFSKGSMIALEGRLELRDWTGKDGNKRRNAEVNVSQAYFCESKRKDAQAPVAWDPRSDPGCGPAPGEYELLNDDDALLPF